ncbi:MAG: MFS transporter [Gammaproteobacteria bacterium]|nr:MFS transporter [Gammaproteobacteria bacterium]
MNVNLTHAITISFLVLSLFLCFKAVWNLITACRQRRLGLKEIGLCRGLYTVELIRPMVFFKLFASCLTVAALPQYFMHIALTSGKSQLAASYLYVMYQTIYILMIIPGGFLVEARNLKRLYILITLLEAIAWLIFGFAQNFWVIFLIQTVFGCLVPLSSATEYAYLFKLSSEKRRNIAIALYSNTLRGAIISGVFIGSILVSYFGVRNVFIIASGIVLLTVFYSFIYLPRIKPKHDIRIKRIPLRSFDIKTALKKFPLFVRDINFLKIVIFVGFSIGLLDDGVVLFSMPLLLAHYHFTYVDIGTILVLFSMGFFVSNKYISKKADKLRQENRFLFWGLLGSALSLILIASFDLGFIPKMFRSTSVIIAMIGLLSLGIFRGFLFSPAIGSISQNRVALKTGRNVALSFYKLFQTFGTILGPILMMNLLIYFKFSPLVYAIIGGGLFIFAFIFLSTFYLNINRST